ncbi:MAG: Fe-S-containing protein [Treponema sp.]
MVPVTLSLLFLLILLFIKPHNESKKAKLHGAFFSGAVFLYAASTLFYYLPVIITLSTTLVYYGESAISTIVLFRLIGYVLGLVCIVCTSLAIYKTLIKLSDMELHVTVVGTLCMFGITQVTVILQRWYSLGIIPRNDIIFAFIAAVVNNGNYFTFAIIVFIMLAPVILWKKNRIITEVYHNNAELRKLKARKRNARRWAQFSLTLLVTAVFSLSFLRHYVDREIPLSAPEDYVIADSMAMIPIADLQDDKLHRYAYTSEQGIEVRFIAIKKSEGSYGIGLDACDICGPTGYFERNGEVVCKLCDVVMNKGTIGFPGGCNPVPVPYIIHDEKIKIKTADLEAEAHRFK